MAFLYRGAGTASNGNNATSRTPTLPTGWQVGDLLVVQVQTFGGRAPSINGTWSSTVWANGTASHLLAWKIAGSGESNPTVTFTGPGSTGDTQVTRCLAFYSNVSGVVIALDADGAASTNAPADNIGPIDGITVGGSGSNLSLVSAGKTNDYNGVGTLTDYTQAALTESTAGNDAGMALLYRLATPSGATGSLTVTDSGGTASNGLGFGKIVSFAEQTAPVNISLACDVGSFALAGQSATLRTDQRLASASGAFVFSGQSAQVRLTVKLLAAAGAFALAGQPATFKAFKRLTADVGAFALAGQDAAFRVSKSVAGDVGTFSVVGNVASFRVARASSVGSFTLTGQAATLRPGKSVTGGVGTFTLTGQPSALKVSKRLISSVGPFTLTGQPATLRVGKKLTSSVGAFTLTGQDARLGLSKFVTGAVGTFILTGQSSAFSVSKQLASDAGAFAATGQPAALGLQVNRTIQTAVGTFALTGQAASLGRQIRLTSGAGSFTLTGQSAILLEIKLLAGSAGSFALTGGDVAFFYRRSQVGQNRVGLFPSPVNSVGVIDSNTVRSNDNITVSALNAHDSDASIHMQSGLLISRPTITAEGATYFCTDTRDTYTYVSNAWVQSGWAHWYGSFSDYTDQTIAAINTATKVTFDTVDMVSGFSLVSGSRMTAAYAGNYNFQWSGQFTNSDSAEQDVEIWVRINGVDVVGSAGRVSVPKRHGSTDGHVLPGWNYFLPLAVGDYVELYWAASSTTIKLEHGDASAWAPSTASIIATMDRI